MLVKEAAVDGYGIHKHHGEYLFYFFLMYPVAVSVRRYSITAAPRGSAKLVPDSFLGELKKSPTPTTEPHKA